MVSFYHIRIGSAMLWRTLGLACGCFLLTGIHYLKAKTSLVNSTDIYTNGGYNNGELPTYSAGG